MKKETLYKVFSAIPTLVTPRLTLRKLLPMDADDMYEYAGLTEVTKYLTWYPHPDRNYTKDYIDYLTGRYATGMFYDWAIVYEPTHKMVGTIGFTSFNITSDSAEVGYVLNPAYWGKGIATEALCRILQFGFETLKLHRIEARFMVENEKSRQVMERVGMQFEGVRRGGILCKGKYPDVGVCAILETDRIHWEEAEVIK